MTIVENTPADLASLIGCGDIECECMLCHLPPGEPHGPIRWKLCFRFPGPYPTPGASTMLLCDECFQDWTDHCGELGGFPERSHEI
jgi:hypothetical protein